MSKHLKRSSKRRGFIALLSSAAIIILIFGIAAILKKEPNKLKPDDSSSSAIIEEKEEPPIVKESTFTLSATGDMLMHTPIVRVSAVEGGHDFSAIFKYFSDYVEKSDCAIANLETTLAGTDNGYGYSGYPNFNCPDEIIDAIKDAGFDLLLTANNHSYDTRSVGISRTVQVVREKGLLNLGTKADETEPNYKIVKENNIALGLLCYTYENNGSPNTKAPNGMTMKDSDAPLINSFDYENLDAFYQEISVALAAMKGEGADASVLFIHWGEEYDIKQNKMQSEMAQKLCDLGIDVIIGGHPHVVQPMELLTSTQDSKHKTVCLYSMGNAVSNQRRYRMNLKTGHTEDGVFFSVTFARYSDGTVILESADLLPTWVRLGNKYQILPLEKGADWKAMFDMSDSTFNDAKESYERTMDIVGEGLSESNEWIKQNQTETEIRLGIIPAPDKIESIENEKEVS